MSRAALLLILVAALIACGGRAVEPDPTADLARATLHIFVDQLDQLHREARDRARHVDPSTEALRAHEHFYNSWYFTCAAADGAAAALRVAGAAPIDLVELLSLERLCKVDLPFADLQEIVALADIEPDALGKDRFACDAGAVAFVEDVVAIAGVGVRVAERDALVERYRHLCPGQVKLWPGSTSPASRSNSAR